MKYSTKYFVIRFDLRNIISKKVIQGLAEYLPHNHIFGQHNTCRTFRHVNPYPMPISILKSKFVENLRFAKRKPNIKYENFSTDCTILSTF